MFTTHSFMVIHPRARYGKPMSTDGIISANFVCLFVCLGLSSYSRNFHSYEDVTINGEGLQILTYVPHTWPLSSEDSLACHTYCDTGHPFIMVNSEDPSHSHLLLSV